MKLELVVPAPQLCTDNGVMVAWAGVERLALGLWEHPPASAQDDGWVDVRPRWPLTDQCDARHASNLAAFQMQANCLSGINPQNVRVQGGACISVGYGDQQV